MNCEESLSSCSYCLSRPYFEIRYYNHENEYRVACDCGMCGPWGETEREASLEWSFIKVASRNCDPFAKAENMGADIISALTGGMS